MMKIGTMVNELRPYAWVCLLVGSALSALACHEEVLDPERPSHAPDRYTIGDRWSRISAEDWPAHRHELGIEPEFVASTLQGVGALGGTWFYLGSFEGEDVFATAHHVARLLEPEATVTSTVPRRVRFHPVAGEPWEAEIARVIGQWLEIDFALVALRLPADRGPRSLEALQFDFDVVLRRDQPLFSTGFGRHQRRGTFPTIAHDEDCRVFSADGDYRLVHDPDTINPSDFVVWSFAHGCDTSHGDSGSPVLDRATGQVVGIFWTGAFPTPNTRTSRYLDALSSHAEEVWRDLSYAVPARKIREVLLRALETDAPRPEDARIIEAFIAPRG